MEQAIIRELARELAIPQSCVKPNANFYQLGGDSMTALALSAACKQNGILVPVTSILMSSTISDLLNNAKLLSGAAEDRIIYTPQSDSSSHTTNTNLGPKTGHSKVSTLNSKEIRDCSGRIINRGNGTCQPTRLQNILALESRDKPGMNVISYFRHYKPQVIPDLRRAWLKVMQSESIFQSTIMDDNLSEDGPLLFCWSENSFDDYDAFHNFIENLETPPMTEPSTEFNVITFTGGGREDGQSTVVWHVHHALMDGFSAGLVLRKVHATMQGQSISKGRSFIELARCLQIHQTIFAAEARNFWLEEKESFPIVRHDLLLPSPEQPPTLNSHKTGFIRVEVPVISQYESFSASTLYYAAWAMTLSLYTGSDAITMGIVFANRALPLPTILETVGPTINTLPLTLLLDKTKSVDFYLHHVSQRLAKISEYQWCTPDGGQNYTSVLALQYNYGDDADIESCTLQQRPYTRIQTNIPINVFLGPSESVQINYLEHMYHRADIATLGVIYSHAIRMLLGSREQLLTHYFCHALPEILQATLMRNGNCESEDSKGSGEGTLLSLFETCCQNSPEAIAVEGSSNSVTYDELNIAASRVAQTLQVHLQPKEVVCVLADRSINWLIAIYAIFKAGAVYCPFDPAAPASLNESYFQTTNSRTFLVSCSSSKDRKPLSCSNCFAIDELLLATGSNNGVFSIDSRLPRCESKDVAYVCFTSGSTGLPKGVPITHEGIVAFQSDYNARLHARAGLRIAQLMSPAFDGSMHEIFSCLSYGGTLILNDPQHPFENLGRADVAMMTPSVAKLLDPLDHSNLESVYFVGEPLPQGIADRWSSSKMVCYNMYGPTESSCGATYDLLQPGEKVTVGKPVASTRIYILDSAQCLTPPGAIGEVYTAGIQVSPGYIARPEENTASFFEDHISSIAGQRMYRTGDRGYWTPAGKLMLLGRLDRQIKLKGFRLDLDDLENRILNGCPKVTAVALARKDDILVALIQPADTDLDDFRKGIRRTLPHQAIPRLVKAVDTFPLLISGKLDYRTIIMSFKSASLEDRLEDLVVDEYTDPPLLNGHSGPPLNDEPASMQNGQVDPWTQAHEMIASLWREVLGLDNEYRLGHDSNFVALGNQHQHQLWLAERLTSTFKQQISWQDVIQHPCLRDQVSLVVPTSSPFSLLQSPYGSEDVLGNLKLSPIECDWLQKYKVGGEGLSSFNVNMACTIDSHVHVNRLVKAFNTVLKRHKILSSLYTDPQSINRCYAQHPPQVIRVDDINLEVEINRSFSLAEELPIRVYLSPGLLLLVASHIVMDLTALRIVINEVAASYDGRPLSVPPTAYSQSRRWSQAPSQESLNLWTQQLSNKPLYPLPNRKTYQGRSRVCRLPPSIFRKMIDISYRDGITMHQLSLAAVALALAASPQHTQRHHDLVLGAPFINRSAEDMETVGLFLEPLPVIIPVPPRPDFLATSSSSPSSSSLGTSSEACQSNAFDSPPPPPLRYSSTDFLHSVCAASRASLAQAIRWDRLLRHVGVQQARHPNVPFLEAMVTFHDNRNGENGGCAIAGLEPLYTWCEGAKFNLMFEFLAVPGEDGLILRLEFDDALYDDQTTGALQRGVVAALEGLGQRKEDVGDVFRKVMMGMKLGSGSGDDADGVEEGREEKQGCDREFWGKRISELSDSEKSECAVEVL